MGSDKMESVGGAMLHSLLILFVNCFLFKYVPQEPPAANNPFIYVTSSIDIYSLNRYKLILLSVEFEQNS